MSAYNIREKFSYILTTSSLDYVRNYNFNTTTVTDIALILANSDETVPITVDMTTTDEWLRIVDPATNKDLRYPSGNVVLQPLSTKTVTLKIDLPPSIEERLDTVIYPSITFNLTTGSKQLEVPDQTQTTPKNKIIVPTDITMTVGETQTVVIRAYDLNGEEEDGGQVSWTVENTDIAQITSTRSSVTELDRYDIRGLAAGTTKVLYTTRDLTAETIVTVTEVTTSGTSNNGRNVDICGNRCTTDSDCSGICSYCSGGICSDTQTVI